MLVSWDLISQWCCITVVLHWLEEWHEASPQSGSSSAWQNRALGLAPLCPEYQDWALRTWRHPLLPPQGAGTTPPGPAYWDWVLVAWHGCLLVSHTWIRSGASHGSGNLAARKQCHLFPTTTFLDLEGSPWAGWHGTTGWIWPVDWGVNTPAL